jgi:molybdopterin/thiamine biosynthesis adenylyltransferase/rhodanese-related sulfurtransferase
MLDKQERLRYSRQMILPEFGIVGQQKLKASKVLMVGAGGLGSPILQYLAAAGVGEIGIVDDDNVDLSNLHRQILYCHQDIGQPKAEVAKAKLMLLNPNVSVNAFVQRLTVENAFDLFGDYELIIDGSDNFETRYLVGDTCVALGKTLVFGSIFKFEGQVSVFNHNGGPTYRDIFPESPSSDQLPNCSDIGVLGVLPGIVGLYMANEAIKLICEIGESLSGTLMTIDALANTTNYFKLKSNGFVETKNLPVTPATELAISNDITKQTLDQWMSDGLNDVVIIDVRESYEFDEYNIGGKNVPLYELQQELASLPLQKRIVFVCQTGQRSKIAVQLCKSYYEGSVYSLENGLNHSHV